MLVTQSSGIWISGDDEMDQGVPRRTRKSVRWRKVSSVEATSQAEQNKDALKRLSVDIDGELLFKFRQLTLSRRTTIREEVTKFVEEYVDRYGTK